jgi:hypothetical protein
MAAGVALYHVYKYKYVTTATNPFPEYPYWVTISMWSSRANYMRSTTRTWNWPSALWAARSMRLLTAVPSLVLSALVSHQRRRAFSVVVLRPSDTLQVANQFTHMKILDARTSPSPQGHREALDVSVDRPGLPLLGVRHRQPQTSDVVRSSSCVGNWGPKLTGTGVWTERYLACFLVTDQKVTCPQRAMPESVFGSDDAKVVGPALSTPEKTSRIVSAKSRCFSRRFASIRSRWEAKIHVDGSIPGAYSTMSGMTSSRRRTIATNGTSLGHEW